MKKYISFFKIRFINGLQYRVAAYAGIATQIAWGFMHILIFKAFYKGDPHSFPMEFSQLSSYIWLQQAFLALFMSWYFDNDIFMTITSGNIAYELSRPMDLYSMWFTKNLAVRLSRAVLRCLPVLLVALLLPEPYGIAPPVSLFGFFMFIITMVLAFLCVVAFSMFIYIIVFYTLSPMGVRVVATSLIEFLTGSIIPLPFFPKKLMKIVSLTPFASMQNLPFRIYSGNIAGREMLFGVLLQLFWVIILILSGRLWMARALKKVVVQGG
ncbi:MAG: ABC transporter permease [Clostridiaceae bacterium]|nr:ABC transporter permease [Clostridiaceae bacterium]